MIAVLRTLLTIVVAALVTLVFAPIVLLAAAFGVPDSPRSVYARLPCLWSRAILWAAGVTVDVDGIEKLAGGGPFVYAANHVSLFDIPALVVALPRTYLVAKSELFRIPVFGPGIRAVGTIPIERENRKAAFGSYEIAAERIRKGASVLVFPEGTRGTAYPIRPFKKGPFVLAIAAQAPVVPCVVYGTIAVLPKKTFGIHPGHVTIRVLDAIPTAGLTYTDRDALARTVHDRMAAVMDSFIANNP